MKKRWILATVRDEYVTRAEGSLDRLIVSVSMDSRRAKRFNSEEEAKQMAIRIRDRAKIDVGWEEVEE